MFRIAARGRQAAPGPPPFPPFPGPSLRAAAPPASAANPVSVSAERARILLLSGQAPAALSVTGPVQLRGEARLRELPASLVCTHLDVRDCPQLALLPEHLRATSVQASRTGLREATGDWLVREHLDLGHNPHLRVLPERLTARTLDVTNCPQLRQLPAGLHLTHWLEVAGSGLTGLPAGLRVALRWQGTPVDERTAFRPADLRAADLLLVRNVTHRRVLLERMGVERFMHEVGGLVLDRDRDAGGERQLLSVPLPDDEPVHVLRVVCPSTAHVYLLRVPPHVRTCRRAAAWLAGFEHERDYWPLIET